MGRKIMVVAGEEGGSHRRGTKRNLPRASATRRRRRPQTVAAANLINQTISTGPFLYLHLTTSSSAGSVAARPCCTDKIYVAAAVL